MRVRASTIVSLSAVAGFFLWFFIIGPTLLHLSKDFSYTAEIFSLDNFYNEVLQEYEGLQTSKTLFSYQVIDISDGVYLIENVFDVRTANNEKIFSVERVYGIDPKTSKHVPSFGDQRRSGYLFAPRNLTMEDSFTYWHVNYNGPAHMEYVGTETIGGLRTYRYETRYQGIDIDQTEQLGHLPGVGTTRGILLEPYLQLWIEPTTGWLVKYQDQTTAFYYDLSTHEILHPWNKFSNTYSQTSVADNVIIAKQLKLKINIIEYGIPGLFVIIGLFSLMMRFVRRHTGVT